MEQLLITGGVIAFLAAATFVIVFLAKWSDQLLQACFGVSLYDLLGFTVGSVLYILRWLVWLSGVLFKICWYLIVIMFVVAASLDHVRQEGAL